MVDYTMWNLDNITAGNSSVPTVNLIRGENALMNGAVGISIFIAVFFVLFFYLLYEKKEDLFVSAAASSFACTVLAVLAVPFGLITATTLVVFISLVGVFTFIIYFVNR